MATSIGTLRDISERMGLARGTLHTLFRRDRERGNTPPAPVGSIGPSGGIELYDESEVAAWYAARSIGPKAKRGPDRQPRKRRAS